MIINLIFIIGISKMASIYLINGFFSRFASNAFTTANTNSEVIIGATSKFVYENILLTIEMCVYGFISGFIAVTYGLKSNEYGADLFVYFGMLSWLIFDSLGFVWLIPAIRIWNDICGKKISILNLTHCDKNM